MSEKSNPIECDNQALLDKKRRQEEFLEQVESNLRRSEKSIWFIKDEDHPQKESFTGRLTHSHSH